MVCLYRTYACLRRSVGMFKGEELLGCHEETKLPKRYSQCVDVWVARGREDACHQRQHVRLHVGAYYKAPFRKLFVDLIRQSRDYGIA